jgi:hypothetical protein
MNSRLADEEGRLKILMDVQARHSTFAYITNGTIESIGTNDLPSVAKKKGVAARMAGPSTEAFPTVGLALQLEVPMVVVASILGRKVGGGGVLELWPRWQAGGGGSQYPARGGSCGHVRGCPATGDPPQGIRGVAPV